MADCAGQLLHGSSGQAGGGQALPAGGQALPAGG